MIAEEIMTRDPRTIPMNATVAAAVDALQELHARHLPVVDDRGILVGIISDRDLGLLMKTFIIDTAEVDEMPYPPQDRSIADLMSTDPIAVREDADVEEIIDTLVDERIGAVPVVDAADRVIGIVSYIDVLAALRPKGTGAERRRRAPRAAAGTNG